MNILNIRTFLYIVRYQSISAAAQAMYTSQPTISSRLGQLEEELGVQLIERRKGHRSIEVTEKGREFIPIAEHWLELDRQTVQFSKDEEHGVLTLVGPGSYQEHVIPQIIHRLMAQPSPPHIRLRTASSPRVYSMVADHDADAGFATRLLLNDGTAAIPVFATQFVLLCPANTVLPEGRISPEQLDPHFEVTVTSWTGETRRWHDLFWDPYVSPYLETDNNHMPYNYLTDPRCWAICPAPVAISLLTKNPDRLVIRLLDGDPPKHMCYLVVQRARLRNRPNFIDRLRSVILDYADESSLLEAIRDSKNP